MPDITINVIDLDNGHARVVVNYYGTEYTISGLIANQAEANYRSAIRNATRSLWSGVIDLDQFVDTMFTTIRFGLTQAWHEGAREVGVAPSELTDLERIEIQRLIQRDLDQVFSFGLWIEQNSKANGGKLSSVHSRAEAWIARASEARNKGLFAARDDPKLKWVYDPAKENCRTCEKLNGKVKRKSFWERIDVKPQNAPNPKLECGGWQCGCRFEPTDEPLSRGRLPGLP
jgi:hypothetical protein